MLHVLKRHPFAVKAFFRQSLVLTYALPREVLQPLLPPGLALDTYEGYGFLAIAMVQTRGLRPTFLPGALGCDFFLSGYRIFVRLGNGVSSGLRKRTALGRPSLTFAARLGLDGESAAGQVHEHGASSFRGLQILRSDTDHRWMMWAGNAFTHYRYRLCDAEVNEREGETEWNIRTPGQEADLRVTAWTGDGPAGLPAGSPFANVRDARRFAGPLPSTFDYEAETHSIIRIRGVRQDWNPRPVPVEVLQCTFLCREPFCRATPILANAFYVHDVPYRWERGIRIPLEAA